MELLSQITMPLDSSMEGHQNTVRDVQEQCSFCRWWYDRMDDKRARTPAPTEREDRLAQRRAPDWQLKLRALSSAHTGARARLPNHLDLWCFRYTISVVFTKMFVAILITIIILYLVFRSR